MEVSLSLSQHHHEISKKEPPAFCDQRFKLLKVTGHDLASLVKSVYFKVMSLACWVSRNRGLTQKYRQLSKHHFEHSFDRLFAYFSYRKHLVDFSVNSTSHPQIPLKSFEEERAHLKQTYGDTFQKLHDKCSSDDIPINKDYLLQYPINKGICLGASVDFVSKYLHEKSSNAFEAVKNVSRKFVNGGTPEACTTQILYYAQDMNKVKEQEDARRDTLLKKFKQEREDFLSTSEKMEEKLKKTKDESKVKKISKKILELKIQNVKVLDEMRRDICNLKVATSQKRLAPLAKANGMKLDLAGVIIDDTAKKEGVPSELNEAFSKMPIGAYLTVLRNYSTYGHAVAFIKASETEYFLFDPNIGTMRFESMEVFISKFWKLTKGFYNTTKTCDVEIYKCSPQT